MTPAPPSAAPLPVIEMINVQAGAMRDQRLIVAEEVNWRVEEGDFWAIAGLQGAGKSDFLMMTAGLMAPATGTYRLFGETMPIFEEERLPIRLRLGLVFDSGQLFNHLTVAENIALPLRYHRNLTPSESGPEVSRLLKQMELEPWADSTPGAIGRNWQKRVGLARALALDPDVLLIDNPLGGLDLRHTNWWLSFLGQLVSPGQPSKEKERKRRTLIVTAAELRPWKSRARQFAVLRDRRLSVLGGWSRVEAASRELLHELLAEDAG